MFLEIILQNLAVTEFVLIHQKIVLKFFKNKSTTCTGNKCIQGLGNEIRCDFVIVVYLFLFPFQDKKDKRTKLQEETKSSAPVYRWRHKRKRWVKQNGKLIRAVNFVKTIQIHSFGDELMWLWKINY